MNITKILLSIIAAIMIVTNTNATTMCVTDDMEQVILDPSVDGNANGNTYNITAATWDVVFPYGTISGVASCNSFSGQWGTAYPEYNNQITTGYQEEQVKCWCRMTSPARSAWVFYSGSYTSDSQCMSSCANNCGSAVRTGASFRVAMYGSAGN